MEEKTKALIIGKKSKNGVLQNYVLDIKSFGNATGAFYTNEEVSEKVIKYASDKKYQTMDELKNDQNVVFLKKGQSIDDAYHDYLERTENKISNLNISMSGKELLNNNFTIMKTVTNRGRIRKNNTDGSLTIESSSNPDIKLLAVTDGIGGDNYGEIASSITIESLKNWFLNLNSNELRDTNKVINLLNNKILEINLAIQHKEKLLTARSMGTTLSMALVLENDTIFANIGNSRIYVCNGTILKQVTEDNSVSWSKHKSGLITKEQMRFDSYNNQITKVLGYTGRADFYTISNDKYDKLLLFTDGVTDVLSDKKIKFITNTTPSDLIADELVNEAVNVNQGDGTCPGKDNATVAVYIKK